MGETRNEYKILVVKYEGKSPLGRLRHRGEVNIRTDLKEIGWKDVHWIDMTQDSDQWWALVKTVTNLRVP
jgi:hypothetical protein